MDELDNYWDRRAQRRLTRRHMVIAGLSATAGAALATACGSSGTKTASQPAAGSAATQGGLPQAGGTLAVTMTTNPLTLDLQRTTSFYALNQGSAVYSRMLKFKTGTTAQVAENHDVEGDLATSWESPDAITWTVKLRTDAKFQNLPPVNGHVVEAEDIRATFLRAISPENPFRSALDMLDPAQISTPDKNTVVFKLKYPFAPFQSSILASANYSWIFPREVSSGFDPAKTMIGSGPFLFDKYTPDVAVEYKRNPDWFGKPQPYVSAFKWSIIPDTAQQRAQFTGGNLDLLGTSGSTGVNGLDLESLKRDNPKAYIVKGDPTSGALLFFNLGDPSSPFQDIRLRRAFSMGIDRDAVAKAIYNNDAQAQWWAPLSMGKWALHQDQLPADVAQWYKFDAANAKKLLQASGMQDQQFKLIFVTGYLGPAYQQAAETAGNMLQTSGFKVTLVSVDYTKDFIGSGGKGIRYGNFDKNSIVFAGMTNLPDIDDYLSNYWHSKGTAGLSHLNDPSLDDQIAKARTMVNAEERLKTYTELQKYMADKAYAVTGFHLPNIYYLAGPRVQNYQSNLGYGTATESFSKLWLKA